MCLRGRYICRHFFLAFLNQMYLSSFVVYPASWALSLGTRSAPLFRQSYQQYLYLTSSRLLPSIAQLKACARDDIARLTWVYPATGQSLGAMANIQTQAQHQGSSRRQAKRLQLKRHHDATPLRVPQIQSHQDIRTSRFISKVPLSPHFSLIQVWSP